MTVYFSVDVETTGPCPSLGNLLSIGVDTLGAAGEKRPRFYATIWYEQLKWDAATKEWWKQQDFDIWNAAREGARLPLVVATQFKNFIEYLAPVPADRCFVACPVAFDWPWINDLFLQWIGHNPFGHRALDLRSLHIGVDRDAEWNMERIKWDKFYVASGRPHHALDDAIAQRKMLEALLDARG